MKKIMVISLGGSLIIPEKMNVDFLQKFRKILQKNYSKYKFIIICGGGTIARKYISVLKKAGKSRKELSLAGINATRTNAEFMVQLFGKEANSILPKSMREIKNNLSKNNVVICGALRYSPNSTSDTTASQIAKHFKSPFINMTNVPGLYSDNPKKNPRAKFISEISWRDFEKMALKIKYKPGQNFVLDQRAATLIRKQKISTFILGPDAKNLNNLLNGKKFIGTKIEC